MNKEMTIFYKLKSMELDRIFEGKQDLSNYSNLELDEAQLIYGYIIVEYDLYVLTHREYFEIIYDEANNLKLQLKSEFKDSLSKYL